MDKISVIMPVFNAAAYITEAVDSALDQPETGEVLLIEDGSTDDSLEVCSALAAHNRQVKLRRHTGGENLGAGASRNVGLLNAANDLISFLDADDVFSPDRFKTSLPILQRNPELDGVYEAIGTFFKGEELEKKWVEYGKPLMTTLQVRIPPERLFEYLLIGECGYFHGNGLLVRRGIFERCGLFHTGLRLCQDTHMWIRMSAVGRLAPGDLTRPVAMRRVHDDNRIFQPSSEEMFQIRSEMWRSLLAWAKEHHLTSDQMALLKYFNYVHSSYKGDTGKVYSKFNYIRRLTMFGLTADPKSAAKTFIKLLRMMYERTALPMWDEETELTIRENRGICSKEKPFQTLGNSDP